MPSVNPINIFISYANVPGDRNLLEKIIGHLHLLIKEGKIEIWDDSKLRGGEHLHEKIKSEIERADMFLLLLSPDFLMSQYIYDKELPLIFEKEHPTHCPVIPIYLRYCSWEDEKRISENAIIPKKVNEPLMPVEYWELEAKALEIVNIKIREIIAPLHSRKSSVAGGQDNHHTSFSPPTLATIWQDIPLLYEDWGLVRTVDCDRDEDFTNTLLADFSEKENDDRNLVYFISACETQNPESVAKRLVYQCDDIFKTYPVSSENPDEIFVHYLKVERRPEETWIHFWKSVREAFSLNHVDFTDFISQSGDFTSCHKRIPFFCTVREQDWTNTTSLEQHLQYIIERFSTLPPGCHKFVLFFMLEFEKLHEYYEDAGARCVHRLQRIARIAVEEASCTAPPHIKQINLFRLVEEQALIVWLKSIIDRRKINQPLDTLVRRIIEALIDELEDSERVVYDASHVFNMQRLEMMQRQVYNHILQLKNQRPAA
ncbi:MAG: toll/interleukin-1 receptor domain-containing protein [Saprospiraceae bacterium]|nr:toll/interleukin-1 receptor domain-containing protein [Saprospiraceae bacterium]